VSLPQILFYLLGAVILAATLLAVTRRQPVHAVIYLVVSFFATALLFALLGAPLPAVLQVMIPAGAVMALFLFILMLLGRVELPADESGVRVWMGPAVLALIAAMAGLSLLLLHGQTPNLPMAKAQPAELGRFVYQNYWPAVEAVSLLFFVALAGALFLVKDSASAQDEEHPL